MTPDGWREVGLFEVTDVASGQVDPREKPYREWPLVAPNHIEEGTGRLLPAPSAAEQRAISGKYVFRPGDVLYSKIRPYLRKVALPRFSGLCSADMYPLRSKGDIEPGYLLAVLLSKDFTDFATSVSMRTGIPKINREELGKYQCWLPPLAEQKKIAAILSSVDDAIEATQAVIDQLAIVKKAMMAELLTRGLPGRHKKFKMTEIGEVPESWEVVSVADIGPADRSTAQTGPFGAQLRPEDFADSGVPVLKIGNVRWGHLQLDDLDYVRPEKAIELERFRVEPGDLLFARQGATTGRNALADDRCAGWLINYHIIRVSTDHERCIPHHLMTCFNSDLVQKQVGREKGRGNRDGINTTNILNFLLPLPSLGEQKLMTRALRDIDEVLEANVAQLEQLRSIKSALMSVLLTGEVRVKPDEEAA